MLLGLLVELRPNVWVLNHCLEGREERTSHQSVIPVPNDESLVVLRLVAAWVHHSIKRELLHELVPEEVSVRMPFDISALFLLLVFLLELTTTEPRHACPP